MMISLIILPYLKRLWLPIAIGLMVLASYCYIHHLQSQRDNAITALNNYKSAQSALANQQIAQNAILYANAQSKVISADTFTTSKLTELHLDRTHEKQALIDSIKRNLVHSLQSSATDSPSALSDSTSDTETATTAESVDNTAVARLQSQYDTLDKACTIETIDYNDLRSWADATCEIVECR